MDSALALVQAYLYTNGFFTVTEYPIVEAIKPGDYRTATDIDILAVRFPGAGRIVPMRGGGSDSDLATYEPDPALVTSDDRVEMLIAEVKTGKAELNRGTRNATVLRASLTRFGACTADHADTLVDELLRTGEALSPSGPRVRLIAFGTQRGRGSRARYAVITIKHILGYLQDVFRDNWDILQHAQFKDPAINFLTVLAKAKMLPD
jgi:hypothetical protein